MIRWLTKKRLFAFHGWLGLTLGLPLFVICLSGACAVMSPEIDGLIHPEMRVTPPTDPAAEFAGWDQLIGRIERACPGGEVMFLHGGDERDRAWVASVAWSPRDERQVFIDPFSGVVLGQRTTFTARSFFRIFHKQFYILKGRFWPHGRTIVCSFSIVLLLSAATGLMFYKGWWKSLFRLRINKGGRVLASDLHRFLGVWSFLFAILFAVTGMCYLAERTLEDFGIIVHDPMPKLATEELARRPDVVPRRSLDELASAVGRVYPDLKIRTLFPGTRRGGVVSFLGHGSAALADDDAVHVDAHTGEVVEVGKAHEMAFGPRLESLVNPLHFGRFGGIVTKLVWTAAGLFISAGILAGSIIWWMRARRAAGGVFRRPPVWSIVSLLLNLAILLLAAISTAAFIRAQVEGPQATGPGKPLGLREIGPWEVEAFDHGSTVRLHFVGAGDPNYRAAYVWRGGEQRPSGLAPAPGTTRSLYGPAASRREEPLRLEIESWDGSRHAAAFSGEALDREWVVPPDPPLVPWPLKLLAGTFFSITLLPAFWWLVKIR